MNGLNVLLKAVLCKGDLPGHEFHGNQWTDGGGVQEVSSAERQAVQAYVQTDHPEVNAYLRNNRIDASTGHFNYLLDRQVQHLDALIARSPAPRDLVLYRGSNKAFQSDKAFISASSNRESAVRFGQHVTEIRVPRGSPVLNLHSLGEGKITEAEYILPRAVQKLAKAAHPKTNVGKLLDAKTPKLQRKINAILNAAGERVAKQAVKLLEGKLAKVSDEDQKIIQQILDALALEDISVDIVDSITPELIRAFKDAGIMGVAQLNLTPTGAMGKMINQRALDYMDAHGGGLIKDLAGTTEDAMRGVLSDAIENGSSPGELANSIQELGSFSDSRAEMIARTELADAHVQGNLEGWRQTGIVEGKEWHAYEGCCDDCAELDGEIVGLDEEFPNDGGDGPPLHPRCECSILSVRNMDEEDT